MKGEEDILSKKKKSQELCCQILVLSLLEVQLLNADCVQECKERWKEHKDRRNNCHKTPVVSKMMCYVVTDCLWISAWDWDFLFQVSVLCHYEPINSPCQWANPVVPDPPSGNFLKQGCSKKKISFCNTAEKKGRSCLTEEATNRSWNEEAWEEVEEWIESCGKDGCNLMVRRDWDSHHAIVGEVEEGEVGNEEEPEELGSSPLEAHHGIYDKGVVSCLDKHIGDLHDNLQKQNLSDSREQIIPIPVFYNSSKVFLYLSNGIGHCRVHPSSPLSVENCPLNWNNWLHSWAIVDTNKHNSCVHSSHNNPETVCISPAIESINTFRC